MLYSKTTKQITACTSPERATRFWFPVSRALWAIALSLGSKQQNLILEISVTYFIQNKYKLYKEYHRKCFFWDCWVCARVTRDVASDQRLHPASWGKRVPPVPRGCSKCVTLTLHTCELLWIANNCKFMPSTRGFTWNVSRAIIQHLRTSYKILQLYLDGLNKWISLWALLRSSEQETACTWTSWTSALWAPIQTVSCRHYAVPF